MFVYFSFLFFFALALLVNLRCMTLNVPFVSFAWFFQTTYYLQSNQVPLSLFTLKPSLLINNHTTSPYILTLKTVFLIYFLITTARRFIDYHTTSPYWQSSHISLMRRKSHILIGNCVCISLLSSTPISS